MRPRSVAPWTAADVPDQGGRTIVITGATSGIGLEAARVLASRGAHLVLACRNEAKGRAAVDLIAGAGRGTSVSLVHVDTSDLASVRGCADQIRAVTPRVDVLINNAGVAWPPYARTADGVELQLATNFLGHFALTGLILDQLLAAPAARVISLTSLAHWGGRLRLDDVARPGRYRPFAAYAQSKLAVLLFTTELQRRFTQAGVATRALAAHPGGARTELLRQGLRAGPMRAGPDLMRRFLQFQDVGMGALPVLRAAVDPNAPGGACYAPGGTFELRGHPVIGRTSRRSRDSDLARTLWSVAQEVAHVDYAMPSSPRGG